MSFQLNRLVNHLKNCQKFCSWNLRGRFLLKYHPKNFLQQKFNNKLATVLRPTAAKDDS